MQVVIGGASGFLGTHLTESSASRSPVTGWYADADRAGRVAVGPRRRARSTPQVIEAADVVVNLAGAPDRRQPALAEVGRQPAREPGAASTATLADAIAAQRPEAGVPGGQRHLGLRRPRVRAAHRGRRLPRRRPADRGDAGPGRPPPQPAREAGARVCVLRTAPVMDGRSQPLKMPAAAVQARASAAGWATAGSTSR